MFSTLISRSVGSFSQKLLQRSPVTTSLFKATKTPLLFSANMSNFEGRPKRRGGRSSFDRPRSRFSDREPRHDWKALKESRTPLEPKVWKPEDLITLKKDFNQEHDSTKNLKDQEVEAWRQEHSITIFGERCPKPILSFNAAPFTPGVISLLESKYPAPSTIQSQAWPLALSGRDMVACAETGSGKTLGFILPALIHASQQSSFKNNSGPLALVLCPTRELAQQVAAEAAPFCKEFGAKIACVFGGDSNRASQINQLTRVPHLIVATPGRLIDFLEFGLVNTNNVSFMVLDEADRMLDMGFEPQIKSIIDQMRPDRQTVMFSATWPMNVRALAREYMTDPVRINIGSLQLSANKRVRQQFEFLAEHQKSAKLQQVLQGEEYTQGKVLIFVATKRQTELLADKLSEAGIDAAAVHGDLSQRIRDSTVMRFKSGHLRVLIATDVASRGLDVKDISHVINYDMPNEIEAYIHRVGRTGRAGRNGDALSFVDLHLDRGLLKSLANVLKESEQPVPVQLHQFNSPAREHTSRDSRAPRRTEFRSRSARGGSGGYGSRDRDRYPRSRNHDDRPRHHSGSHESNHHRRSHQERDADPLE
jgi:ATP-dependent RNA helicase DDX5/DBP2